MQKTRKYKRGGKIMILSETAKSKTKKTSIKEKKSYSPSLNKELNLKRLFLHAYYLSFYYDKKYEFILDLPDDLKEVLSVLEKDNE